jgi:hypothetical protein
MEPINYLAQVADPFAASLKGYASVDAILNAEAKRAEALRQQQLQQQQQQQLAQEQARFFTNPNPTMRDAARYASLLSPEQANAFRPFMEGISKEQQQGTLKSTGQLLSALQTNPEIFISKAKENALAARNSGDEEDATLFEQMAEAAADPNRGPAIVFKSLAARTAGIPGAKEMFETIDKSLSTARAEAEAPAELRQKLAAANKAEAEARVKMETATDDIAKAKATREFEQAKAFKEQVDAKYAEGAAQDAIKKRAADLGLTTAQTNQAMATTKKLGTETKKAALELAAIEAGVGDPKEKFGQEEKIRKEWQGRSKVYSELQGTFNTLQASASSANGPGDIALITGFMKMLDPGSVVRETEFATARDTAGLFTQLENRLQKAKNGELLGPAQRAEYVALSKKYLDSAQTKANQEKKDLGIVVKNYKLNPENVFGAEQAPPPPLPASATVGGKTYPRPANFTDAQWGDYLRANGVIQ